MGDMLTDRRYHGIYYFIVLCILAFMLNDMFLTMRDKGFINIQRIEEIPSVYQDMWYLFLTLCFGAFYGASIIALFDIRKRPQSFLILVASSIVIYVFSYVAIIRPLAFIVGFAISAYISYSKKEFIGKFELYPEATFIASFLVLIAVWLSFMNYLLGVITDGGDGSQILWYMILTVLFCIIFYKFSHYEIKDSKIFVIGPQKSGKSFFMCTCCERAKDLKKMIGTPSDDLLSAIKDLKKGELSSTVEPQNYLFRYLHGKLFVNEVELDTLDVGGEFLENRIDDILSYVNNINNKGKNTNKKVKDLNIEMVSENVKDVGHRIYDADKLIFIIDSHRIKKDDDYMIDLHMKVINAVPNKPYYIVITKSDKFYDTGWGLNEEGYKKLKQKMYDEMEGTNFDFLEHGRHLDTIPVFLMESHQGFVIEDRFITLGYDKILEAIS